jgi:hypothetical protein
MSLDLLGSQWWSVPMTECNTALTFLEVGTMLIFRCVFYEVRATTMGKVNRNF